MSDDKIESLRRQYNAAIANNLVMEAKRIDRVIKELEKRSVCSYGHTICTFSCGNCPTCFMHEKNCTFWDYYNPYQVRALCGCEDLPDGSGFKMCEWHAERSRPFSPVAPSIPSTAWCKHPNQRLSKHVECPDCKMDYKYE